MAKLLFLCELVVTIILFIMSTIVIKNGKNEESVAQNRLTKIVLTVYTLVASYILLWNTCMCGHPLVSVPPLLVALITMNLNWIFFILKVNKLDSKKLLTFIVIAIFVEVAIIVILAGMIPETYHSIKATE